MSYKIAVASSDGIEINETFGNAKKFIIYEVDDGQTFYIIENRVAISTLESNSCEFSSCKSGCHSHGCNGEGENKKVEVISDCRCVICSKIGFKIVKQLEKKAITAFDVECSIYEAINKIVAYYNKVDNHLRLV